MLGLAPTVSPPIQTHDHPYSGHFGKKYVDSLVRLMARITKASFSARSATLFVSNFCVLYLGGHRSHYIIVLAISHTHVVSITPEKRKS